MIRGIAVCMLAACGAMGFSRVSVAVPEPEAERFIQQSVAGLEAQQAANDALWKMRESSRWAVDQDTGAYRGPTDGPLVFMVFGKITLARGAEP